MLAVGRYGQDGGVDFTTSKGPQDDALPRNEIVGYSQVSRIGEVVINAFIDTHEWSLLPEQATVDMVASTGDSNPYESRPMFHDWATVLPGMLCLARKNRTETWRRNLAAESAIPVVGCASCVGLKDEADFFLAGVCRSKSVIPPDDGLGPKIDEFFTLSIGGMQTWVARH
jgi:hypothetical protein